MLPILTMPGYLIRRAHQQSTALFTERMAALGHDITPVQFGALCVIGEYPGVGQAVLADMVAYDRVTIGGVVDRLESKGLVKRSISARDRRARMLTLTPAGKAVLGELMPVVAALQDDILGQLGEGERQSLIALLNGMLGLPASGGGNDPGSGAGAPTTGVC